MSSIVSPPTHANSFVIGTAVINTRWEPMEGGGGERGGVPVGGPSDDDHDDDGTSEAPGPGDRE
jgi:hypothetical protein